MKIVMLFMQKIPRLVSEQGSDTNKDKREGSKMTRERHQRSEQLNYNLTSIDSDLPGVLCDSSVELAPKVLRALKKLESSFIFPEATKLVEEHSGAKASDETSDTSEVVHESSETSKSETGRGVTDYDVAHFLLDVCSFAWLGKEPDPKYEEPRTFH